jgi:hypothetical protein
LKAAILTLEPELCYSSLSQKYYLGIVLTGPRQQSVSLITPKNKLEEITQIGAQNLHYRISRERTPILLDVPLAKLFVFQKHFQSKEDP